MIKQGNALVPTFTAFAVVNLLQKHFPDLVDFDFTARMEDDLDAISLGAKDSIPYLKEFYFGDGDRTGLHALTKQDIDARDSCTIPLDSPTTAARASAGDESAAPVTVRVGRYGPYLERGEQRAAIPEDLPPDELDLERALQLLEQGSGPRELGIDPATGKAVLLRSGRFGPYVQLGEAEGDEKPKMKSLLPGMTPDNVTLEQAARLLSLPRDVGVDPDSGETVVADYGRYGPYLKRGTETRSLDSPEDVFEIGLEAALKKLLEPKPNRRRGPTALRELGADPAGNVVKLMAGRYGPYVTDGTTNASLPRGADPGAVTIANALELLEARRNAGPEQEATAACPRAQEAGRDQASTARQARSLGLRRQRPAVQERGDDGSRDRADQVDPQVRVVAGHHRGPDRARRVEAGAGERTAHEDAGDERHADREPGMAARLAAHRSVEDGVDQEEREEGLDQQTRGRGDRDDRSAHLRGLSQGGRSQPGLGAAEHDAQRHRAHDAAQDLDHDVGRRARGLDLAADPQPDGDRGIDVRARDVPVGVSERDDDETVGERDADQAAHPQGAGAGPDEDERERTHELGDQG